MEQCKPKVLFVTGVYSPFQLELSYEINKLNLLDYYLAFTVAYSTSRGKHWLVGIKDEYAKYISIADKGIDAGRQGLWARQKIEEIKPQIVIMGFTKGPVLEQSAQAAKSVGAKLALWAEPPNLEYSAWLVRIYAHLVLKKKVRHMEFVLGIGESAVKIYRQIFSGSVYFLPYAQDLSVNYNIPRNRITGEQPVTFLFSGQIIKRHNIRLIAEALIELYNKYPDKFRFVMAGYGPEEDIFREIVGKEPGLKKQIMIDRDYEKWEDRIRPFSYSDVLLYPSRHAGWGLVVPEAMAAGMVVITNRNVESARYYIRDGISGIIIDTRSKQLLSRMEWCIKNKHEIYEIGQQARNDVRKGTAGYVAGKFCEIMQQHLK